MVGAKKSKLHVLGLGLVVLVSLGSVVYHFLNKAPQIWDSAAHINLAMMYADKLRHFKFAEMITLSGYYPPFIHLIGAIFYLIVPILNSPLALTFVFYTVGLIFLYKLSRELSKSEGIAIIACLVFALLPQTYRELRVFQLDLPLTSLLICSLYFLHSSKGLTNKKASILFFILTALAQLTKWYAFVYIPIPFLYELIRSRNHIAKSLNKTLIHFTIGIVIVLILTAPWYALNYNNILGVFRTHSSLGELNDPQNPLSKEGLSEYFKLISVYQTYFVNFAVFAFFMLVSLIKREKAAFYSLLCILIPYGLFTILVNKDVRYLMPISPYITYILATGMVGTYSTLSKRVGKIGKIVGSGMVGAYIVLNILLFVFISFNQFKILPKNISFVQNLVSGKIEKYNWMSWNPPEMAYHPQPWYNTETYNLIKKLTTKSTYNTKILFAVDHPYFNKIIFDSIQIHKKDVYRVDLTSVDTKIEDVINYDFVITSYNPGPYDLRHRQAMIDINGHLGGGSNVLFESKGNFSLPNGENIHIYRQIQ